MTASREEDPALAHFIRYLRSEKNASEHTVGNYLMDIEQFYPLDLGAGGPCALSLGGTGSVRRAAFSRRLPETRHGAGHDRTKKCPACGRCTGFWFGRNM
jgi:hypothetical protein